MTPGSLASNVREPVVGCGPGADAGSDLKLLFAAVNKTYGDMHAVRDLNLQVASGEFFTLLGPSGSGKTTTLRMLAGLESVSSGQIVIDGRDVSRDVAEKRNIGLVFQNYALFPHMTVAQNVGFPLKMRREPRAEIEQKVADVLDLTGLSSMAGRLPNQLSGGQQQRVALARAFVFDPSLLLMDEPLGALDRNLRDHMRVELKSLQRRIGATVLYVTHDQDEALAMSDRIGIMHGGVLQQVASPVDIYERPANSFVAKFLGDSICVPATRRVRGDVAFLSVEGLSGDFAVDAVNDVCSDDRGALMVRPEKLTLYEDEPRGDGLNRVRGTVEATVYLGAKVEIYLRDDAGGWIQISAPPSMAAEIQGRRLWASWPISETRFLPIVE